MTTLAFQKQQSRAPARLLADVASCCSCCLLASDCDERMASAAVWGPVVAVLSAAIANVATWAANEHSAPFRHVLRRLGVRPLLFTSNRAEGMPLDARPASYWAFDLLSPHHLVASHVLPRGRLQHPLLLALHACTFLYWVATVIVDVAIEYYRVGCDNPSCGRRYEAYPEWMTFLTNWSISLLGIAGLVALANTARHVHRQRRQRRQQRQQQHGLPAPCGAARVQPVGGGSDSSSETHSDSAGAAVVASSHADSDRPADSRPRAQQPPLLPLPLLKQLQHGSAAAASKACAQHSTQRPADGAGLEAVVVVLSPQQQQQQQQQQQHGGSGGSGGGHSTSIKAAGDVVAPQPLGDKWDALSVTHCLLMEVATTAALFVTILFWAGVVGVSGSFFSPSAGTFMAHAGNVAVAGAQVLLTRLPLCSYHFQVLLLYGTLYELLVWIYGSTSGTWRYGLDWTQPRPAGVYLLIPVVCALMFCAVWAAAAAREAAGRRLAARRGGTAPD